MNMYILEIISWRYLYGQQMEILLCGREVAMHKQKAFMPIVFAQDNICNIVVIRL